MTTTRRTWFLASAIALAACYDVTLVEPDVGETPQLGISILAVTSATARYDLYANLSRGRDRRGEPTAFIDDKLYVEATPISPDPETTEGISVYRWQPAEVPAAAAPAVLNVAFPVLAGLSTSHFSVRIPVPQRVGPAEVEWTRGNDLLLRVSPPDGSTSQLSGGFRSWSLDIGESCEGSLSGPPLRISGEGSHPNELRVPSQWVDSHEATSLAACLRSFASFEVVDSPYLAYVSMFVQLHWQIRVVNPTTP